MNNEKKLELALREFSKLKNEIRKLNKIASDYKLEDIKSVIKEKEHEHAIQLKNINTLYRTIANEYSDEDFNDYLEPILNVLMSVNEICVIFNHDFDVALDGVGGIENYTFDIDWDKGLVITTSIKSL